jgi:hypothetical protein
MPLALSEFGQKLLVLLIDKVLIAGIAFVLWHYYSRLQRRREAEAQKVDELRQQLRALQEQKARTELADQITLLERQLTEFYWPFKYCINIDSAVWEKVPQLNAAAKMPGDAGHALEKETILTNHERALDVIEKSFGLVASDQQLVDVITRYVRHVAVYRALRAGGAGENPIDVGEPYPEDLPGVIEDRMATAQKELDTLRQRRFGSIEPLASPAASAI